MSASSETELMNLKASLSEHAEALTLIVDQLMQLSSNPEIFRAHQNIFNVIAPTVDTLQQKLSSLHSTIKNRAPISNYTRSDSAQSFFNAIEEYLINKFLSNPFNLEIQGDAVIHCNYTNLNFTLRYQSDGTLQANPIISQPLRDSLPEHVRHSDTEIVKHIFCTNLKQVYRNHPLRSLIILPFFISKFELVEENGSINCYVIRTP